MASSARPTLSSSASGSCSPVASSVVSASVVFGRRLIGPALDGASGGGGGGATRWASDGRAGPASGVRRRGRQDGRNEPRRLLGAVGVTGWASNKALRRGSLRRARPPVAATVLAQSTATVPRSPTVRPAVTSCSSGDGVPASPTLTSSAPVTRIASATPNRKTSAPRTIGATEMTASANPAALASVGPSGALPSPLVP